MLHVSAQARLSVCLGLAAIMALSACAQPSGSSGSGGATVKIVSSLPRTGSSKGQTETIVNGIKMAIDEQKGQIGNLKIEYDDLDDATAQKGSWAADKEADNANKAVNDPQVVAYIGTFNSGAAAVSIPILCKANLVMVSPANTYPGLTKPGKGEQDEPDKFYEGCKRNYTRVVPADDLQGSAAANWAKDLGVKNVYVLDDTELYGRGIATVFADTAKRNGLNIVGGPEGIDPKASDYRALAQKIRGTNPELVYFGGITQNNAGKLLQDLKAVMPDVKFMGPDGIYEKAFIDAAGPAGEGAYITFGGVPAPKLTGKGADWYKRYKDRFQAEPEAYAAYGYEAANVVLAAIGKVGNADRVAIRDAVFATKDYDGALGKWSFDANGDTTLTSLSGRQVKNGAFDDADAVILKAG